MVHTLLGSHARLKGVKQRAVPAWQRDGRPTGRPLIQPPPPELLTARPPRRHTDGADACLAAVRRRVDRDSSSSGDGGGGGRQPVGPPSTGLELVTAVRRLTRRVLVRLQRCGFEPGGAPHGRPI